MKDDMTSLTHTKWECKYHIVFAPKFRRKIIYGKIKMEIEHFGVKDIIVVQ